MRKHETLQSFFGNRVRRHVPEAGSIDLDTVEADREVLSQDARHRLPN